MSDNDSEEAINRQFLKLVSYVLWPTKKHMHATCSRGYVQAVLFPAQMEGGGGENSLGRANYHISAVSMK